jgi:hypothetical protein
MCIFVAGRQCPYQAEQVPFKVCELCIDAWKTQVAIRRQEAAKAQSLQAAQVQAQGGATPVTFSALEMNAPAVIGEGLREIDILLQEGSIDPSEYVMLRKQKIDTLREREVNLQNSRIKLDFVDEPIDIEIMPAPRQVRVVVVVKTMLGKQVYTSPGDWELPKSITDKVTKSVFQLMQKKKASEIKLRAGDYKMACIRHEKDKFALMVLDVDEEFETYGYEIARVNEVLGNEKTWAKALKKLD